MFVFCIYKRIYVYTSTGAGVQPSVVTIDMEQSKLFEEIPLV